MPWHFTGYWLKDAVMGEWQPAGLVVTADTQDDAVKLFWRTFYETAERHRMIRGVRLNGERHPALESVARDLPHTRAR